MNIVFYCGASQEPWSPKSIERGIGGSEEMTIRLAEHLGIFGNQVTVYNNCSDEEGEYGNVKYENYEYFENVKCDVIIFWRTPQYVYNLRKNYKAKKVYLWLHDCIPQEEILPIKHFIDGLFVLSGYHSTLYPLLKDKYIITQNSVDLSIFDQKVKRNPKKIVYGSSYDRGLKELLEMWPEIKIAEPEATLEYFYGTVGIDKQIEAGNTEFTRFKEEIEYLSKQDGVKCLGRLSHKEVAKEYLSAGVWCYPCWFPEISCITAMHAQIGGAIPVITPTSALMETVKWGLTTREPRDEKGSMPWGTHMNSKQMDEFVRLTVKRSIQNFKTLSGKK
jgi:glycosyltransferase involved in cell wall biosynthesis